MTKLLAIKFSHKMVKTINLKKNNVNNKIFQVPAYFLNVFSTFPAKVRLAEEASPSPSSILKLHLKFHPKLLLKLLLNHLEVQVFPV